MKRRIRTTAMLLVAGVSACTFAVPSYSLAEQNEQAPVKQVLGDTNSNGKLDIADATAIQEYLAGIRKLDDMAVRRSKVCGNKGLSITDAAAVHRRLANIITRFPAEGTPNTEEVTKIDKNEITIYFSERKGWTTVNAQFFNHATGEQKSEFPGEEMTYVETDDSGNKVYSATVDVSKYDRVIFNDGETKTTETPVTKASSGYYIKSTKLTNGTYFACVYTYGKTDAGKLETVTLHDYPAGYDKDICIWTPEGYDPSDKSKKYSVLYMTDGDNLFGQLPTMSGYEWACDESVTSLMANGGDGVIVVGITSLPEYRDYELIPNLGTLYTEVPGSGEIEDQLGGAVFSEYLMNTIIPYVEANYNTNSIRGIAGSSNGGICALYIGLENLDKFRYIGAFSPAFALYDKDVWNKYLTEKNFFGQVPNLYIYCGKTKHDTLERRMYPLSIEMEGWLTALGYPDDKVTTVIDDDGTHSEAFWALYFPEMLGYGLKY